jgi:class 3 adenylate cyclase
VGDEQRRGLRGGIAFRVSIAFTFAALSIACVASLGVIAYRHSANLVEVELRDKLRSMLGVAAAGFDTDTHVLLKDESQRGSPEHTKLIDYLTKVKAANPAIRYAHTLRKVGDKQYFVADEDATNKIGTEYTELTARQNAAYTSKDVWMEPGVVRDRWGVFISGTAPLYTKAGVQDGVLGMDIKLDRLEEEKAAQIMGILIACIIVGLISVAFGVWFSGRVARPLVEVEQELARLRVLDLGHPFEIRSRIREVASIGDAVVNMKNGLRSFRKYVPGDVVEQLIRSGAEAELGAHRRTLTIFFSDIAGFTSISEQLTPEQVVRLLDRYLAGMSRTLVARDCTIDKFIGDAVMGFWGAPNPVEHPEASACRAALDCIRMLEDNAAAWQADGFPPVTARIGLHTGEVVVGNIGFEERLAYTIIGDAVNLASRLEGTNKYFGTRILVSDVTLSKAGDEFATRCLGTIVVKGRTGGVKVHELVGLRATLSVADRAFIDRFEHALELHDARDFAAALAGFEACLAERTGDKTTALYVERCRALIVSPPGDGWTPALEMHEK